MICWPHNRVHAQFKPTDQHSYIVSTALPSSTISAANLKGITSVLEITLPIVMADLFDKERRRLGLSSIIRIITIHGRPGG